jgi:hypothetical protein
MVATPSSGAPGQQIVIHSIDPCGGQDGDGPTEVLLNILKPDGVTEADLTITPAEDGSWTYTYTSTDQLGTYNAEADCADVLTLEVLHPLATDFAYGDITFDIAAATTTTTASTTTTAPATTTTAAAQPVTAEPAFTG